MPKINDYAHSGQFIKNAKSSTSRFEDFAFRILNVLMNRF